MFFALVIALAVIGFGVVAIVGYFSYRAAKKRRESFAACAASRGWTYTERDDRYAEQFSGSPFGIGDDRQARNILTGVHDGRAFAAFDYEYSTTEHDTDAEGHSRTRTETHPYSVIALAIGHPTPELSVTPEGFLSRMVGRILNNDIEFESEQFNRAFTVNCVDRKFATDVIHLQMMEFLLTLPDLAWSLRQGHLVTASPGQHTLESLDATLTAIDGIVDRIPDFIWRQSDGGPSVPG